MQPGRWDDIFQKVLNDLLSETEIVRAGKSRSVGSERSTLERLNYQFVLSDPRDRILWNPMRRFNVYGAIARFLWMLSGNERLKDIAFYEPKVLGFSDDALTVPGSNYGKRLFMPEPGLDQIRAIIDRLQKEPGTRRAAAVVYRPEDAVRTSRDIPCAFGLAFHARGGRVHTTMIMRSNAAWTLLPYNLFEFTLLGELVAVLAGMELGQYTHLALSMHIYTGEDPKTDEREPAMAASRAKLPELPPPMPPMPQTSFDEIQRVTQWEAELRYDAKAINVTNYRDYIRKCCDNCQPYWTQLCLPLLAYVLFVQKKIAAGMTVLAEVEEPLRTALVDHEMVRALNIPGLEEDAVLLESRLNLLRYADGSAIGEARREVLWRVYNTDYVKGLEAVEPGERRRQTALSLNEWERRNREFEQRDLF